MVQGEVTNAAAAVTPSLQAVNHASNAGSAQTQANNPTAKLYENVNGLGDPNGEKKKKVGNYIISKTIGEGSFAKVRLGYHLITQQMVY